MRSHAWGPNPVELVSLEEGQTHQGCAPAEQRPTQETLRRSCLQVTERGLGRNQTCTHLDLGLLTPRTVRKKFLLLKSQSVAFYYQPSQTELVPVQPEL